MVDNLQLPQDWTIQTLGSLGKVVTGKTPSTKIADYFGGYIPFVTPSDMDDRRVISHTNRYLTVQGAASVSSSRIPAGTVMVSCIGSDMGKTAIAGSDAVTNQQINSIIVREDISNVYVYYNLSTRQPEIQHLGSGGSAVPILNKGHFCKLHIALPPLKEQQAIACILGALDDKIELNRRMNKTLEETAQTIFKSWFVDFDPVRAKAAIRREHPDWSNEQVSRAAFPNLKPEIAALFPDTFDDSEMGEIPRGWGVHPIGDMVKVLGGGTPSTKEPAYWEGGIYPFCTPKDMASLSAPVLLQTERHLTDEGLAKVSSGKLPIGTLLLSSRAPIGYLAVAETQVSINQGIIAMVCDSELPNLYVLHWTRANMDRVIANANGSTFLEISKQNFRPIRALIPDKHILEQFIQIAGPIHKRVVSSLRQIQQLAAIRDALLPKLISGELTVAEAEQIAARCV